MVNKTSLAQINIKTDSWVKNKFDQLSIKSGLSKQALFREFIRLYSEDERDLKLHQGFIKQLSDLRSLFIKLADDKTSIKGEDLDKLYNCVLMLDNIIIKKKYDI